MKGTVMVEHRVDRSPLRFAPPASVLSWSLAMWIFGPKLLIHSSFTYILALLVMILSWALIPLAVIFDTDMKRNIKKQDTILKVMYAAATFSILYSAAETVIDHFIYGKAVVRLFLWDVIPSPLSKLIEGPNYETNIIFLLSFLLILPFIVLTEKSKILSTGYRSSAVLAGVFSIPFGFIMAFSTVGGEYTGMRYFNPISKFIFIVGVPIVSWGIAKELFLWIKPEVMDLRNFKDNTGHSATLKAKRLLPAFRKKPSWKIKLTSDAAEFLEEKGSQHFRLAKNEAYQFINLFFPSGNNLSYPYGIAVRLEGKKYRFILENRKLDLSQLFKWLGSTERIFSVMKPARTIILGMIILGIIAFFYISIILGFLCIAYGIYLIYRLNWLLTH